MTENAAIYELECRLKTSEQAVIDRQRELINLIEAEKRAHTDVERARDRLNAEVARRQDYENALRRLSE